MPTFIVANNTDLKAPIRLDEKDAHHLTRSLRAKEGDRVCVTNNAGLLATLEIISTAPLAFKEISRRISPPLPDITLGIPLIQHERLEWAVEKLSELGISRIQLITTSRCQLRDYSPSRLKRLEKIARSAQVQSGRAWPVSLLAPLPWRELRDKSQNNYAIRVAAVISEPPAANTSNPGKFQDQAKSILALVGPEGGFTEEEVSQMQEDGFTFVSLGETILRTETAALALACRLRHETSKP